MVANSRTTRGSMPRSTSLILLVLAATAAQATTIRVPSEQPTIQAGVDVATYHDTVLVAPGVYTGDGNRDISITKPGICVRSESGPEHTAIDCEGLGRAFIVWDTAVVPPTIDGFSIVNGVADDVGGAIRCHMIALKIRNCVFARNSAENGGAIHYRGYDPEYPYPAFLPIIENCTFVENDATNRGAAIYCHQGVILHVRRSVLYNNTSSIEAPIDAKGSSFFSAPYLHCCDVFGNSPGDWIGILDNQLGREYNFSEDPLFCDVAENDFRVDVSSRLLASNNPCGSLVGAWDMSCSDCWDFDLDGHCSTVDNCPYAPNPDQADADNDGQGDLCEDDDGDRLIDFYDNCPDNYNPLQEDLDSDGLGDACDDDIDGDDVSNASDNCPAVLNPGQGDLDTDEIGDACDVCPEDPLNDPDLDGICNSHDNCPSVNNPDQIDTDSDGIGELCDDNDDDSIVNANDNCPETPNPSQQDSDHDGIGDACDVCPYDRHDDEDEDGICGDQDNCPLTPNPDQADSDMNGVGDICEFCCEGRVGDANHSGGDEPTIGDISAMIDMLFLTGRSVACVREADVNQSGGYVPNREDITIGDISELIDYLFITGPTLGLAWCW